VRRPRRLSGLIAALTTLVACTGDTGFAGSGGSGASGGTRTTEQQTTITVFAASSLSEAFDDLQGNLRSVIPSLRISYSFAGSPALVTQIEQGAAADVVATADNASMKKLVDGGLVEQPVTFARNQLEIVVRAGNPKGIVGIADLARDDIAFVTEDDNVPAGRYAAQIFEAAGITVKPKSKETNVKAAVGRVTSGEADATIAYVTDARAGGELAQGVVIPDAQNVVATYPIAIVKATKNHDAAQAFVDAVLGGPGQSALLARGFLPGS
jgi:molybdate transport system substrate-binding protein